MSERNLHVKPFDEGTDTKLKIYRDYVRSWLPVFLNGKLPISRVQIFDFFAGPGCDVSGKSASPLIAIEESFAAINKCTSLGNRPPAIDLYLNELSSTKSRQLKDVCSNCKKSTAVNLVFSQRDFCEAFEDWLPLMKRPGVANLIFLDQNGVKQVTKTIFRQIASLNHTDYLFYIASSIVNRFKEDPSVIRPLPIEASDLKRMNGTNVHRIICDAYRRLLPSGSYAAPFSIRKGANVYGLIYGTGNILGLEKFLSICWTLDKVNGEANFPIEGEDIRFGAPYLFAEFDKPRKLNVFENELERAIVERVAVTNRDVCEFALVNGFLPRHAREAFAAMVKRGALPCQKLPISYESCFKKAPIKITLGGHP